MTWALLGIAAIGSAVISGLIGMAGGITLLAAMTLVMPIHVIVPLHGAAQLVSNFSRTLFLVRSVDRKILLSFLVGVPFGGFAGYQLLSRIERPEWVLVLIALLLLYVAFRPKNIPELKLPAWGFSVLAFAAATLGCLIGATGPLLAPFFVRSDLSKETIVATKAACQIFIHLVKLPVFFALSFNYSAYIPELVILIVGVIIGTKIGTSLLGRVSTDVFMKLVKGVMSLVALRLIYKYALTL